MNSFLKRDEFSQRQRELSWILIQIMALVDSKYLWNTSQTNELKGHYPWKYHHRQWHGWMGCAISRKLHMIYLVLLKKTWRDRTTITINNVRDWRQKSDLWGLECCTNASEWVLLDLGGFGCGKRMKKDIPHKGTVMEMHPSPRMPLSRELVAPAVGVRLADSL